MSSSTRPFTTALQAALAASIVKGTFVDTTYYLYSQCAPSGKARNPRSVFANSTMMRSSSDFFAEQLAKYPLVGGAMPDEIGEYDYETDSDLDEDEIIEDSGDSMSDLNQAQSTLAVPKDHSDQLKLSGDRFPTKPGTAGAARASSQIVIHTKYRIFVPNIAATTWQALISFLYTGKVFFAPISSLGEASQRAKREHIKQCPDGPSICSPKSMYRLAKLVGLEDLSKLAKDAIQTNLPEASIADELFSRFSSSHPTILAMQLDYLYGAGRLTRILPRLRKHIQATVLGEMPHAKTVLNSLFAHFANVLDALPTPLPPTDPAAIARSSVLPSVCKHGKKPSTCKQAWCRNLRKKKAAQKSTRPQGQASGVYR